MAQPFADCSPTHRACLPLSWVCSLYRVFFQPAPSVLALLLALAAAEAWSAFLSRNRSHLMRTLFADRVSKKGISPS